MAAQFSGVGRAIGATVSVFVLITIGWVALVSMMYDVQSQWLVLASPLCWATITTSAAVQLYPPPIFSSVSCWIIIYAVAAAALFLSTLSSFDRRLGRADDAVSWLCFPSRLARMLTFVYVIASLCIALFVVLPSGDPTFTSFGTALLFGLGLLHLAVRGSWPLAGDRAGGLAELQAADGRSCARLLIAKWSRSSRLVPGVLILPFLTASAGRGLESETWEPYLILLGFMLSVSLAAVSVGVAMFAFLRGRAWAPLATAAVWGLSIADWIVLGAYDHLGPSDVAFVPRLPVSGVAQLCVWMHGMRSIDSFALPGFLFASALYVVAAALLMLLALAKARNGFGRTHHQ
jgi:hypothetical protein